MRKPNKSPGDLEELVVRIHDLIEPTGAKVTWNKKVPDPDTGRLRQIDGLLERDGKNIHIECRDRTPPQDVRWVEELFGRRTSLKADGMIGVSLSGFTKEAKIKARTLGIILRTFSEMTNEEITDWGGAANVIVNYANISKFEIVVLIDSAEMHKISIFPSLSIAGTASSPLAMILDKLLVQHFTSFNPSKNTNVSSDIQIPGLFVDGAKVLSCNAALTGRSFSETASVIGVWNYHGTEPKSATEAVVSGHSLANAQIIQNDDAATMVLDLSSIKPPKNCYFQTCSVDFGRRVRASVDYVGKSKIIYSLIDVTIDVQAYIQGI